MRKQEVIASSARTGPNPPPIISVTDVGTGRPYNNAQVNVLVSEPFNGKLPISSYAATSTPGSIIGTSATTTIPVVGLQSATSYTFVARATNAIGTSANSSPSPSVLATTVPERPIAGTATVPTGQAYGANANVTIPFTAGANGGKTITSYTIASSGTAFLSLISSPGTISETSGIPRLYNIRALNANGTSDDSPNLFPNALDIYAFLGPTPTGNNCTLSRDASAGPSPANGTPLKMTFTGTANDPYVNMYNSPSFNIGPEVYNQPITFSVYVKGSKNMGGQLFIFGANSAGGIIGGSYAASVVSITTSWTRVSYTYTPTSIDTRFVQVRLDGPDTGGVAGDVIWWDGLQVEYGSTVSDFNPTLRRMTSNVVLPSTVPQAPTIGTATRVNNSTARVAWTANANGGLPITTLGVESNPSISLSYTTSDLDGSVDVTGSFVASTSYTFRTRVANANGNSDWSAFSNSVVINVPAPYWNPPVSYFNPPPFTPYWNPPTPYWNPPAPYFNPPAPYFNPPAPYFNPPAPYFNPPSYFNPPLPYFNPPKAPSFKCIHGLAKVLTTRGYVLAKDIKIGDKLVTVDPSSFTNIDSRINITIDDSVKFVETEVTTNIVSKKQIIRINDLEEMFSNQQPIFVKHGDMIKYKDASDILVGDSLVRINKDTGKVSYVLVEKVDILEDDYVYEIRTEPHLWFIVGESLVVS